MNWGKSIVLVFAFFIAFILYFVFEVQSNAKYDNELVVEEYYKHDARFDDELKKLQNAEIIKECPIIINNHDGVTISFPNSFELEKLSGKVSFYRPSAKNMDFNLALKLASNNTMSIPLNNFKSGRWNVMLNWQYNHTDYLIKKEIYIH